MMALAGVGALIALVVVVLLVRPLLRAGRDTDVSPQRLNVSIYREQLEALEREHSSAKIGTAEYEVARDELQLRLLDDEKATPTASEAASTRLWSARATAWVLALFVPFASVALYALLGAPLAVDNPGGDNTGADNAELEQIQKMVQSLADRLKANPDDSKGWAMLARSYKVMGRFKEAEDAYVKAGPLLETDPDLIAGYADLLGHLAGDNLDGKPLELVNKALGINPRHPMALMLSGVAAYRQGNFGLAVSQWEKLLTTMEAGSPDADRLRMDIAEARSKLGQPQGGTGAATASSAPASTAQAGAGQPPGKEQILQMVDRLAERLKSNPGDLAGWARLARSYKVLGRLDEAEAAYLKAGKLVDTNADMLADFADLLATRAGGKLEGRPAAMLAKALALDPRHPMTLMMLGTAAYRSGDFERAVTHWETLQALFDPKSPDGEWVKASLADARAMLKLKKP